MLVRDIIDILEADIITAADLDVEVKTACGSDMMLSLIHI